MNVAARIRARRIQNRNRRAINTAINNAATSTVRDELITLAHQQHFTR